MNSIMSMGRNHYNDNATRMGEITRNKPEDSGNGLTAEQKACAMDKLSEMLTQAEYCPIKTYCWYDAGKQSNQYNVTVDGWYADHEFDTLEEAIVSAYETWKREWRDRDE
jgi:hypothetical protein